MRRIVFPFFILLLLAVLALPAQTAWATVPTTLRGSPASISRQNEIAKEHGLTFIKTPEQIQELVAAGELVPLDGNADYTVLQSVHYPFGRPEVRLFIERLAAQYREATGEKLVVTSLTRPSSKQPRNAHALSVHPTGIAIDLRISSRAASRQWLESTLLSLEEKGLLDVTRERRPPHYHVALFPEAYRTYVEGLIGVRAAAMALLWTDLGRDMGVNKAAQARADSLAASAPEPGRRSTRTVLPLLLVVFGVLGYRHVKGLKPRP